MVKLRSSINKAKTLREFKELASEKFKDTWQPDLQEQAYIQGVTDLINTLQLPKVEYLNIEGLENHPSKTLDDYNILLNEFKKFVTKVL